MDVSFQSLDEHEVAAAAPEILALIKSIDGASSVWSSTYLRRLAKSEAHLTLVAISKEPELIGTAIIHTVDSVNPLILNQPHLFLRRLVIAPRFRRAGHGLSLLRCVADTLSDDAEFGQFSKIGWQTNVQNADGLAFFRQIGFHPIGRISVGSHIDEIFSMYIEEFYRQLT